MMLVRLLKVAAAKLNLMTAFKYDDGQVNR